MTSEPNLEHEKQRWKEAERAFDFEESYVEQHNKQVVDFAILGIRTIALTAAGGIAASLGFYSANYARLAEKPANLTNLNAVLACMFSALLCVLFCCLTAYFSQLCYVASLRERERHYQFPYVRVTDRSKKWSSFGDAWRIGAIILAILATTLLCVAGLSFLSLVQ
jgi:hypothetical protein